VDLGLYFYGEIMAGKDWTEEEIKYLKENGAIKSCKEIAEHLGRTVRATQHKFGQLGLEKRKAQVGDVINGWEIVEIYEKEAYGQKISMAKIKSTICNKSRDTKLTLLTNKKIKGPGKRATGKNMTHGETGTRLHRIWKAMRTRTKNANADKNNRYINRGIDCCKGWDDYIVFRDWSLENGYSDELSIDRIDNDKGYYKDNCRWATREEQQRNINKQKNNKVGYKGVYYCNTYYKYVSKLYCNGKTNHLGYFDNIDEAIKARKEAELKYWK